MSLSHRNLHQILYMANATPPCDVDCPCSSAVITPVCGVDNLTYLSPCFAGCTNVVEVDRPDFDGHKSLVSMNKDFTELCKILGMNFSNYQINKIDWILPNFLYIVTIMNSHNNCQRTKNHLNNGLVKAMKVTNKGKFLWSNYCTQC